MTELSTTKEARLDARACRACGTWVCDDCGALRAYASRFSNEPQRCPKCSSSNGRMRAVVHRLSHAVDHDESYGRCVADNLTPRYQL